jgi:hypothetical protein
MFKWLTDYKLYLVRKKKKASSDPYIEIISEGIDSVGRIKIEFDWNTAFILHLRNNGFEGTSEEEIIQKWFQAITLSHSDILLDDDLLASRAKITPANHPDL